MKNIAPPTRVYRQTARAKAAVRTGERILRSFTVRLRSGWVDEIRLDDVAADARVTVQTVIRRFGGKEGLLEACLAQLEQELFEDRQVPAGGASAALDAIIVEYELRGEFMLRLLVQEDRYTPIRLLTDRRRASHRRWVGEVFQPFLSRLAGVERLHAHERLVIALDLSVWKLLRVDVKRSTTALRHIMLAMCAAALGTSPEALESSLPVERETA